ncbi:hypothetical protein JQS43_09990 [Natronosporangium hydrolyticum]|uniref:Hydrogenase maturation nickel metallochaperone HypA n=1 Tax=Natronosporangium hydrolyticum TaxID=2811111 RepID=A0A895YR25_9ACTN|nr:DUF6510 family protein [Natronosporangium hydrolyticum]QSB16570.1 hypothetical protein JQS43_09990 [Natronosporangium hydrolyticum]
MDRQPVSTTDYQDYQRYQDYQDGNALAGPLSEIFTVDVTSASGECVTCGLVGPVASLRLYHRAPGLVARCPSCDEVVLRLVRTPRGTWLDLRGMVFLRLPRTE